MPDPWCKRCGGQGVISTPIEPRIENGRLITAWCTPCYCGTIDLQDFGPMLARLAAAHENGGRVP